MILELDVSLGGATYTDTELQALENLATGYREGNFILSGDPSVLTHLGKLPSITARSRAAYKNALSRLPEALGLAARFSRQFRIIRAVDACAGLRSQSVDGSEVVICEFLLSDFAKTVSIQRVQLLAESEYDCEIYEKLFQCVLRAEKLNSVKLAIDPQGIGGSNLAPAVEKLRKSNNRFFFVLADSDLDWSGGAFGDTAKQVVEAYGEPTPWGRYVVLPVREIENLAPHRVAKSIKAVGKPPISEVITHSQKTSDPIWKYLDLKEGLRVRKWVKIPKSSSERILITKITKKDCVSEHCEAKKNCAEKCDCLIFSGFGSQVCSAFKEFLEAELRTTGIKERYEEYQWPVVRDIALEAATWCCRREPFSV